MPHMANLPWIPAYAILLMMVLYVLSNLNYSNFCFSIETKKNKKMMTKKWMW